MPSRARPGSMLRRLRACSRTRRPTARTSASGRGRDVREGAPATTAVAARRAPCPARARRRRAQRDARSTTFEQQGTGLVEHVVGMDDDGTRSSPHAQGICLVPGLVVPPPDLEHQVPAIAVTCRGDPGVLPAGMEGLTEARDQRCASPLTTSGRDSTQCRNFGDPSEAAPSARAAGTVKSPIRSIVLLPDRARLATQHAGQDRGHLEQGAVATLEVIVARHDRPIGNTPHTHGQLSFHGSKGTFGGIGAKRARPARARTT